MEEDYISISTLNDFIFCPYSIYLHNVYMGTDESLFQATPQIKGKIVHESVDDKKYSTRADELQSMTVYSEELGVVGKIDLYHGRTRQLVERKNNLKTIFRGQIYQLWAQYFCMIEMGHQVESLAFYEVSTNKMMPIALPTDKDKQELMSFIERFRHYDPNDEIIVNPNKCRHCIYCNLCDKTDSDNVYQ